MSSKIGAFTYLHEISSQAEDFAALLKKLDTHQRRKRMEAEFGPIVIYNPFPPIPNRSFDYEAYFDRYLDLDMPSWARGFGPTEAEALEELLNNAEEHLREVNDAKYQGELQRRVGCHE